MSKEEVKKEEIKKESPKIASFENMSREKWIKYGLYC
jgi:hypothetical protein